MSSISEPLKPDQKISHFNSHSNLYDKIPTELANISLATKEHEPTNDADVDNINSSSQKDITNCKSQTRYSLSLPPEILFSILPRAIPPYPLLDTSLSPGERSAWCQTLHLMQSIVLVCRSWYDVGVIFLYENICIRRCHQLESLRWTLTSSSAKHLSLLVKSLTIQCCFPKSRGVKIGTDLEVIMGCCTSLSTFSYNARFIPPAGVMSICFPAYITHFRLDGDFDYDQLFLILIQLKDTLLSFNLMVWDYNFEKSVDVWSQLHLPTLQSLSLTIVDFKKSNTLNLLRSHLTMPSLRRLTVAGYDLFHSHCNLCDRDLLTAIFLFLEFYGGQLQQLHIHGFRFTPEAFIQVLSSCPQLERIILHPSTFLRHYWTNLNEFFHPNLRCIDLAHYLRDKDIYRSSQLHLSKKNLPALECVRHFCNFPGELRKWLDECSPNAGPETEEFVIDIFQHQLDCRKGLFVWRFERGALEDNKGGRFSGSFTVWEDDNTDSDSDYRPTHSDGCGSFSSEDLDSECETATQPKLPPWR